MHDIYLSTIIFHTLATVGLFGVCAGTALLTPPRRQMKTYRAVVTVPDRSTPSLDAYERKLALDRELDLDSDEANVA